MRELDTRLDLRALIASGVSSPSETWVNNHLARKTSARELEGLIDQPQDRSNISRAIEVCLTDLSDDNRSYLALLLSKTDVRELSIGTQELIDDTLRPTQTDIPFRLKHTHSTMGEYGSPVAWSLCSKSELRMTDSMKHNMVLGICIPEPEDDKTSVMIAVKSIGRIAGLCIQTTQTPAGTIFVEGVWYAPTNRNARATLKRDITNGVGRKPGTDVLDWVVQRACDGPLYRQMSPKLHSLEDYYDSPSMFERHRIAAEVKDDYVGTMS